MSNPLVIERVAQDRSIERAPFEPRMRVAEINDYLLCFYDGRDIADYPVWLQSNIDMQLGVCCYVLHRGNTAIIFDTMLYKEHILWIDRYLRDMGIKNVSVINSHWDCDHIAGNFLYKDRDIISTTKTRLKIATNAEVLRSGEIWARAGDPYYPGIDDLVLPNRTFDGCMVLHLEDIEIHLIETFIHQLGHLVAYLPKDRILLCADACEDTVPFNTMAMTSDITIQMQAYRELHAIPAERLYPCHGRFDVIANGGYTQDFTAAMLDYNIQLINRKDEPDFLTAPLESFIEKWVAKGTLAMHEPYRSLHANNVGLIQRLYAGQPKPSILQ